MGDAAVGGGGGQAGEEFVFAVEAAVGVIGYVGGVVELAGFYVFVADMVIAREGFGVCFVGFGE